MYINEYGNGRTELCRNLMIELKDSKVLNELLGRVV